MIHLNGRQQRLAAAVTTTRSPQRVARLFAAASLIDQLAVCSWLDQTGNTRVPGQLPVSALILIARLAAAEDGGRISDLLAAADPADRDAVAATLHRMRLEDQPRRDGKRR